MGPPVPIPNTEVKPCGAEDSWLATACENREMPTLEKCPPNRVGVFILFFNLCFPLVILSDARRAKS